MERRQLRLESVVNSTIGLLVVYLASVLIFPNPALAFGLCGLTFAATAWMALRILQDPHSPEKTFDDQFYQDRPDIRRIGPE